ncbi:MAG: hypothetical protein ACKO40_01715 [Planctomycetaceae bacterium]
MPLRRRHAVRNLAIASAALMSVACYSGLVVAATHLWECNYCHQQYQGAQAPAFAKCPAKNMKQNHWWIRKN